MKSRSLSILALALPVAAAAAGPAHAATLSPPPAPIVIIGCTNFYSPSVSWAPSAPVADNWAVGLDAGLTLHGDCAKISADAHLAVTATGYGFTAKAMDVHLTASTDNARKSSIDVAFLALGYEVEKVNLASSTTALSDARTFSLMLPSTPISGWSKSGSYGIPHTKYSFSYKLAFATVGSIAGLVRYSVSPAGIDVALYGNVNARAEATASATVAGQTVSGTGSFVLAKASGDASGSFAPTFVQPPGQAFAVAPGAPTIQNAWRVRGGLSYWIQDAIHGVVLVNVDTGAISGSYKVIDYAGLDTTQPWASNVWSYDHTYMKSF